MILGLSADEWTALGAVLAGLGSLLGGFAAIMFARRQGKREGSRDSAQ